MDVSKMKVADLKKELETRGLSVEGKKTDLQERLTEAIAAEEEVEVDEDTEEALLEGKAAEPAASRRVSFAGGEPQKKIFKLDESANGKPVATATDEEKTPQQKRAERFGIVDPAAQKAARAERFGIVKVDTAEKKAARAARFGIVEPAAKNKGNNKKAPKLDTTTGSTDIEKLKSRAARFGEISSKTLKKVSLLEKKKERAEKFKTGEVTVAATNGKAAAAPVTNGKAKVPITMGDSKEAEIKAKRAERFAAK